MKLSVITFWARGTLTTLLGLILVTAGFIGSARCVRAAEPRSLEIYFIDVEGGQSTLLVTPDHRSLLIDTGYAGDGSGVGPGDPHQARDANRIVAAARDAGISRIDYLLITHFHPDHDGGVYELSQLMPIRMFIDHGVPNEEAVKTDSETKVAYEAYTRARNGGAHLQPRVGDRLPLKDLDPVVVSTAGSTITEPLATGGATNPACKDHATPPRDPYENPRSTGILVRYGKFSFLDLGDLTGQPLYDLVCPKSLIGPVDVYLVAHHGGPDVEVPETFAAFRPRVAIMNNGLKKGGALVTYQALHQVRTLEDVWQLHRSGEAGDSNYALEYVANVDESTSHWIKLVASRDGSFRVFNQRTGESKRYAARTR